MSMIDYGAMLRVNGKFVNKEHFFMEYSDTGYTCKVATDEWGNEVDIDRNYFVYAGDEDFMVVFYKGLCRFISHNKILKSIWDTPFISETIIDPDGIYPNVEIRHLDTKLYREKAEPLEPLSEWICSGWVGATGNERISDLQNGWKYYKQRLKQAKRIYRLNKNGRCYSFRTNRYVATWNHNGKQYECIYGYGVDPSREIWDYIKDGNHGYNFTETERKIIDEWYERDMRWKGE